METKTYTVLRDCRLNGQPCKADSTTELTERQAKYPLLNGQIEEPKATSEKAKKAPRKASK